MTTNRKTEAGSASRSARPQQADESQRAVAPAQPSDVAQPASDRDVADFVQKMKSIAPKTVVGRGRLMFAMDATMSRQPTWDMALSLQADMFHAVRDVGGL